mgnify:CR=1 FL=1
MSSFDLVPMDVAGRLGRLRGTFDGGGVDALIVTNLTNVRYLTGFTGSAGLVVVTPDRAVLVTDGRYGEQAPAQVAAAGAPVTVEVSGTEQDKIVASALTGTLAWEWVNPVSLLHRGLIFGMGGGLFVVAGIFLYDLLVASRGWCGHLCPMGAFYGLLGKKALVRISASRRSACDDCMDCFAVCPEPQVIRPALKKAGQESPLILASDCTTCGRCIDVCDKQVFKMTHRFDQRSE